MKIQITFQHLIPLCESLWAEPKPVITLCRKPRSSCFSQDCCLFRFRNGRFFFDETEEFCSESEARDVSGMNSRLSHFEMVVSP